jgi:hypothetical protein
MSVCDDDDLELLMYDLSGYISEDSEEEYGVTGWVPVTEKPVGISIDGVDQRLLATARVEVPTVLARIKKKLFGNRRREIRKVHASDFLKAWMDPSFLGILQQYMNSNMPSNSSITHVSESDISSFIRVELFLSFYKVSADLYFNKEHSSEFPSAAFGISQKKYASMLIALGGTKGAASESSAGIWLPPMTHNSHVASGMEHVRKICSHLAFIPGTSNIGLDDDLLRLRSNRVVAEGYSQINNPNKGLGVIHHGAVSNTTSLYLAGHVASRAESTIDCVKIIMRSLSGASVESHIRFPGNSFYWDRGYGGTDGEVNTFAMETGAHLVGTAKRMNSFPYTFDQQHVGTRQKIKMKGTMASYWSERRSAVGGPRRKQFAMAHRSGLGRVVLMQTTRVELGPGQFTLISRAGKDVPLAPNPNTTLSMWETTNVTMLTEMQRTPEWFLLRKFRITGTSAFGIWNLLGKQSQFQHLQLDENVIVVLECLGIQHVVDMVEEEDVADEQLYTPELLIGKTVSELKDLCRSRHLTMSGTKALLIQRICAWVPSAIEEPPTIMSIIIKSSFMAPFKSQACREGTMNEPIVMANIGVFVDKHSPSMHMEALQEYGLLTAKDDRNAAFSPDGIAVFVSPMRGRFIVLVEVKSKCTAQTEQAEIAIALRFGQYHCVNAVEDAMVFKESIPDASYRGQLVHGMCCAGVIDAIFVVASLRKILRVVHVSITNMFCAQYMSAIGEIGRDHLAWVSNNAVPEDLLIKDDSHAVDHHSIQTTLELSNAMVAMIAVRGRPLPAGRHLVPELIAEWNRGKGPIDGYSRFQKNVKAQHSHLGPVAAIWLRLIMTMVYNAYHSYVLSRCEEFLMSDRCTSFRQFQKEKSRQPSFHKYCSMLARDISLEVLEIDSNSESESNNLAVPGAINNSEGRGVVTIAYNKRKSFFVRPDLIARRRNRRLNHEPVSTQSQASCIWCCRETIMHSNGTPHSRHGLKTKWKCTVCNVPLCKVMRMGGKSCFTLFHESDELFNPCDSDGEILTLRPHSNRPPPPVRQRDEANGDRNVFIRAPMETIQTQKTRRSKRQRS